MSGGRKLMYYLLIIALCLSGPGLLTAWKLWVEPHWGTVVVVQAVKTIPRGERIGQQDVKLVKLRTESKVEGATAELSQVLGQETARAIRPNEQLTPDMLNTRQLLPGPGEWNMPLPQEWIFGKPPGSLLRGDQVSLLPVSKEEAKKLEERPAGDSRQTDPQAAATIQEKLEQLQIKPEEESKLQNMIVSYAKGTNNQEIASGDDRKKPTGSVTTVELIVTDEQKELIRKYGAKGYRFLIVYR